MSKQKLHSQQIVACIWDFDKTLIPDYMQTPLFKRYKVDAQQFWQAMAGRCLEVLFDRKIVTLDNPKKQRFG